MTRNEVEAERELRPLREVDTYSTVKRSACAERLKLVEKRHSGSARIGMFWSRPVKWCIDDEASHHPSIC